MKNTTLCYIEKDGKYLMLHRTKKSLDENRDKWIGIGGKFEDKESPEDCVMREVREETGLTLTDYCYRGIVTFVSDVWQTEYMHLFTSDSFTGEITACHEGELLWVKKENVYDLCLWEGDKLFLKLLQQKIPFFSLKLEYQQDKLILAVLNGSRLII
ncbi:MAG TPA: DNA mismatch repair protein MutT [Clostridiales bacterium]|nr:DNA mismatch repair protein MutT [Clostridiales bacterium]